MWLRGAEDHPARPGLWLLAVDEHRMGGGIPDCRGTLARPGTTLVAPSRRLSRPARASARAAACLPGRAERAPPARRQALPDLPAGRPLPFARVAAAERASAVAEGVQTGATDDYCRVISGIR